MHECLACESSFTKEQALEKNTPLDYSTTYCSYECYLTFEEYLKESKENAQATGLIDADGNAILQTQKSPDQVRSILGSLGIKITKE